MTRAPASRPVPPPRWSRDQLEASRQRAIEEFRRVRMEEPLEDYLEVFERYQASVEDFLELTVDLTRLEPNALAILTAPEALEVFRYLAGPPISTDDLKVVADVDSLAPGRLRADPELVRRLMETVLLGLDRRRFPWVAEAREPTEVEHASAVLASAALIAAQKTATSRRNVGKRAQEDQDRPSVSPPPRPRSGAPRLEAAAR